MKEKVCRAVKKIITAKDIDEENKLNDDDNLKNSALTSKDSKGKLEFTKPIILTWFSSHIQAQLINSTFTVELSPSTSSWFRLSILFYWNSVILTLTLKHKNADMSQLEFKCHITEVFKKNKIIQDFEIKFMEKWDEFAVAEKKVEKAEQKIKHYSEHWSEKTIKYFAEIHDLKSKIKRMQKLHDENKIRTAVKNIMKNFVFWTVAHWLY